VLSYIDVGCLAFSENSRDEGESTQSRQDESGKADSLSGHAVMAAAAAGAATVGGPAAGELRKTCRPGGLVYRRLSLGICIWAVSVAKKDHCLYNNINHPFFFCLDSL
jgi:hypothetical protein